MKLEFNRRNTTIAVYAFLVLAAVVLFSSILGRLSFLTTLLGGIMTLLRPFIYGFGLAYLLNPVLKTIEKRILGKIFPKMYDKPKRAVSVLFSYLFAFGVVAVFFIIVLPQLWKSLSGVITWLYNYVNAVNWNDVMWWVQSYLPDMDVSQKLVAYVEQYAQTIVQTAYNMLSQALPWMGGFLGRVASGLLDIIVGVIISVYVLSDKERFSANCKRIWYAILPTKRADWVLQLASDANRVFGGFISGKILDSVIIGVLCFAGMSLLRMPNVMLVSVIVGVTNVIPYFGPFIGAVPSFFIILIDSPIKALWFLVFVLLLQQFDGNILGPKILGDSTGLSAFWVIFSIMLFGGLYGFIGMFLGVPIFSVIYMLAGRMVDARLKKKDMPISMEAYCSPEAPLLQSSPRRRAKEERAEMEASLRKRLHIVHTVRPLKNASSKEKIKETSSKQKNDGISNSSDEFDRNDNESGGIN